MGSAALLLFLPLAALAALSGETVVFEDRFAAKPAAGWRWLREDVSDWRVREGALGIHVRPGDAQTVRHALVRRAPDRREGRFALEVSVTNLQN
jgi:hypothetical protein